MYVYELVYVCYVNVQISSGIYRSTLSLAKETIRRHEWRSDPLVSVLAIVRSCLWAACVEESLRDDDGGSIDSLRLLAV